MWRSLQKCARESGVGFIVRTGLSQTEPQTEQWAAIRAHACVNVNQGPELPWDTCAGIKQNCENPSWLAASSLALQSMEGSQLTAFVLKTEVLFFFIFLPLLLLPKVCGQARIGQSQELPGGRRGGVEPMLSGVIRDPQAWLLVPWAPPPTVSPFILFVTCSWPPLPCRLHVTSLLCAQILGPLPEGCRLNGTSAVTGVPACAFPAPFLQWAWNMVRLGARGSPALASCSPPRCEGCLCTHVRCVSPRVHIPPDKRRLPHVYCWAACCRRQVWALQISAAATLRGPRDTSSHMDPKNCMLFSVVLNW